jgi:chromosome segregation ATPase
MRGSDSSTSSLAELVKDQIGATHNISEKALNQSSILESLQAKVNEVLRLKEQLMMVESQLKIAQEQCRLQEAEFAFQRSDYEADIEQLRDREAELLKEVSRVQAEKASIQNVNVDVLVAEAKAAAEARAGQWQTQAKELQREIKTVAKDNVALKTERDELQKRLAEAETKSAAGSEVEQEKKEVEVRNEELERALSNARAELEEAKSMIQQLQRDLKEATKERTEEKAALEENLQKAHAKIQKQKERLSDLSSDRASLASASEEAASQMKYLEHENAHVRGQAKDARRELRTVEERLSAAEEALEKQNNVLALVESEHENLSDLLGLEPSRFDEKWTDMTQKVEELMADNEAVSQLKSERDKLLVRLDAALQEQRARRGAGATKEGAPVQTKVVQELERTRVELDKKTKIIGELTSRGVIANRLAEFLVSVSRGILDLHRSLCGSSDGQLRPVIFVMIFAQRLLSSRPSDSSFRSLDVFGSKPSCSPMVRLKEIRAKFTDLTQQLLMTKQNVLELSTALANVTEERDIAHLTLRSNSKEVKINRKKMSLVKSRMKELQSELSSLVSPEAYAEAATTLEHAQLQVTELQERIRELEREIETRNAIERKFRVKHEELEATTESQTETIQEIRLELTAKNAELNELTVLLQDRTKEILTLERLLRRQKETESSTALTVGSLIAENKELQAGPRLVTWREGSPLLSPPPAEINPAFLGQ